MEKQKLSSWIVVAVLLAAGAAVPTALAASTADEDPFPGAATLELVPLVRAVLERNPSIEAARAAWRAAAAMPAEKRSFDDPMVGYSFGPESIGVSDMRYGQVIELGQRIPFPGKRGLRGAIAEAEARAAEGDYASMRRDVALMATILYAEYYAAFRAVEVNTRHARLLDEMLESARASYVAGRIPQHGLVRVELQLAHVHHDAAEVHSAADVARAGLNALLHRAPFAALPPPPRHFPEVHLTTDLPSASEASEAALAVRSEIASARARVEAADAGVSLARREYFPDLTVGGEYNSMWGDPEHRLMLGVKLDVPIQLGRRKAALRSAEAEAASRRAELASIADTIAAEADVARRRYAEALHIMELYRNRLLPAAKDVVTSARAGFTAATADFGDMIDAEHELRDIELQYEMSVATLAQRLAELQRSIGRTPGVEP